MHFDNNCNQDGNKLKEILENANMNQNISELTHIKGHLLDLVITNMNENVVSNIQLYPPAISDHKPMFKLTCCQTSPRER